MFLEEQFGTVAVVVSAAVIMSRGVPVIVELVDYAVDSPEDFTSERCRLPISRDILVKQFFMDLLFGVIKTAPIARIFHNVLLFYQCKCRNNFREFQIYFHGVMPRLARTGETAAAPEFILS